MTDFERRVIGGVVGGFGGTLALTGLRGALERLGMVHTTAPEQVIERLEEVGLLEGWSPGARRLFAAVAHLAYGVGIGTAFGLASWRIFAFGTRTQPCDGLPGISSGCLVPRMPTTPPPGQSVST